jgi:inner membrane protein
MRWSILPIARVERQGCRARVSYNDARFSDGLAADRFWVSAFVPTDAPGC